jgi:undecaprenyl-diphosphatase
MGRWAAEDVLMTKLVGLGSKKGSSWLGRVGDVAKQPPTWAGAAGVLALSGPRGRQAALRGSAGYVAAAALHMPIKLLVNRRRPPLAWAHSKFGPLTSSFPSGHCAGELAFSLGAAQEIPLVFIPLYAATLLSEWSLVRSRSHYPSDVFGGAAVAIVVSLAAWKLWPPSRTRDADPPPPEASGH